MAPLRSLLWYAIDNRDKFGAITLMYGARTPTDMLFRDELVSLVDRSDMRCLLTVDQDPIGTWRNHVGLLPALFDHTDINPATTYAAVCGPPVVFRFVLERLLALGFTKDRILMSLERRMKCGVGKCGHCSIGYKYTCIHGPIFTYWDAINLPELI
jgi:NAD(P)H-flavin reductase